MRKYTTSTLRFLALLSVAAILGVPRAGLSQSDDSILFTTIVPPNVLLILDNSGSMNHVMWHPEYDDVDTPTCTQWTNTSTYYASDENDSDEVLIGDNTFCGNTRTVFSDSGTSSRTRWSGRYLNWYFSDAADSFVSDILSTTNGSTSDCLGSVVTFGKYRRTRIVALRQVMREVTCLINEGRGVSDGIRFGIAQFRDDSDPHGGWVSEEIGDNTTAHMDDIEADIQALEADAWTPLGETLFHSYLYFMSRSATSTERPLGADGSTRFPKYPFRESDGENADGEEPGDPMQYPCQKNFVIVVTDGEPTKDDFDTSTADEDVGFADFSPELIGDYIAGDETEEPGDSVETAWYMDDIARFMHETDFRPDLTGDQTLDIYTVGFATTTLANTFLDKVADEGNGLYFQADDADALATSLLGALTDIVEKTTSFTASTVPASRTVDGADFYTSFFLPFGADPFWQGHLQAYHITGDGDIVDSNGDCALNDPTTGECNSGPFLSAAVPFWDAGEEIPAPGSRTLYTQKLVSSVPTRTDFTTGLSYTDLALSSFAADGLPLTAAPNRTYSGTRALNEEGLADEIVQYERGCDFGTGVQTSDETAGGVACTTRSWRLADIFHSNPIVVGRPGAFIVEPSYQAFKAAYATRDREIYAGSNGGFVHGFHAGDWDAGATPTPKYTEGTGTEIFGFMPAYVRQRIKYQPEPNATAEHYYVDGSPDAADVWHYPTATTTAKATNGSEWKTTLVGGLRQGGESYYALDVTDPSASGYPGFLWEFPVEGASTYVANMGETWGAPVMTKIKVKVGSDTNSGAGYERWVVIVTAGYDETGDPNLGSYLATGTKGRAIFVLDAKTGAVLAMENLVGRTDSSVTATATESYAIASTPAVLDTTFDGYADIVYVGDLGGNMWKWVIHPMAEDRVNDGSGLVTQPSWTFRKFFEAPEAVDGASTYYKSIFYPPSATLYRGKLYVAFGSGERTDLGFEGPAGTGDDNRFWVMTDTDPFEVSGSPLPLLTEADLSDVTSDESCQSITTRGFFFTVDNGEKFVTNSEIFARNVIVASFTPTDLTDPCESGGGQTSLYVFDILCSEGFFGTSGSPDREFNLGAGFPTDPRISAGPDGKKNVVFIEKSRAEVESIFADDINAAGSLLYWRELP